MSVSRLLAWKFSCTYSPNMLSRASHTCGEPWENEMVCPRRKSASPRPVNEPSKV